MGTDRVRHLWINWAVKSVSLAVLISWTFLQLEGAEIVRNAPMNSFLAVSDPEEVFGPDSMNDQSPFPEQIGCDSTSYPLFSDLSQQTQDWFELRKHLEDDGITFNFYGTQFYQGVAAGGRSQEGEYGGKFDYLAHLNAAKLGNPGLMIDLHGESRLGTTVNQDDGLIAPSNIAMNFPEEEGNVSALTGLKITQALNENFAVFAGKINTLDEYPLRFTSRLGLDRPGDRRFYEHVAGVQSHRGQDDSLFRSGGRSSDPERR